MTSPRDHALDGLRGLAAMLVMLSHVASMTWTPFDDPGVPSAVQYFFWHLGAPAVDLFFVLSGYVVARSLLRTRQEYGSYLLSRAIRLYPVAWAGVLAGLALRGIHIMQPSGSSASLMHLHEPLANGDVIGLATLVAPVAHANLANPPLWSIIIEMQVAVVMPALAWIAYRRPVVLAIAAPILLVTIAYLTDHIYPVEFCGFAIGAAIAGGGDRIIRDLRAPIVLMVIGILLLATRHIVGTDSDIMRPVGAVGAGMIIVAVRAGTWRKPLSSPLARRLGRISYPIYAIHWPIMAAGVLAVGDIVGITTAAVASIPATIAAAWFLERRVDGPAVMLSHLIKSRRV